MSDENKEPTGSQDINNILSEAKSLLDEIKKIKIQTDEHLKAAEASRKGADEHASYANQAKINTEKHSKETAVLKGTAEADTNSITQNKQASAEAIAAITREKADIDADTKAINDRRKEIDQSTQELVSAAKTGTTHLQGIEKSKTDVETFLKDTKKAFNDTNDIFNQTQAVQDKIEKLSTTANELIVTITSLQGQSSQSNEAIAKILKAAETDKTKLGEIITQLLKSHETAIKYEGKVKALSEELDALIKRTDALLPGVTSASLASSFRIHKERFWWPKKLWMLTFVFCIICLVAIAIPSFLVVISEQIPALAKCLSIVSGQGLVDGKTWGDIFRGFVMRLPIVIPLVWLAIYAGRNYMLSIRLEEDYAYKEAVSMAFEGYKREMEKIDSEQTADHDHPINTLCVNILKAIAERPGRIYEGKYKDITLPAEIIDVAKQVTDLAQKQTSER